MLRGSGFSLAVWMLLLATSSWHTSRAEVRDSAAAPDMLAAISGHYSDPSNPGCSVYIEVSPPQLPDATDSKKKTKKKKQQSKRNSDTTGEQEIESGPRRDSSRTAVILRSVPGDGEVQCYFNGSDSRLPPVSSTVTMVDTTAAGGGGRINITGDFSAEGGSVARHGVLDLSGQPRKLVWEADSTSSQASSSSATAGDKRSSGALSSSPARAGASWQQLPLTGFYSDSSVPRCRRQVTAETLTGAQLMGADAKTQVGGCDGLTDVMWQNRQRMSIDGLRVTVHYSRRYSYAEEVHEQMRTLKREEANAINGRDLDDPRGDWWDQPGDVTGTLQVATGNIVWDDGTIWERHDGSMHDKLDAASVGRVTESQEEGQQPRQQSQDQLSRDRRQRKVQELREKAAKQAGAGQRGSRKQHKQPKTVQSPPKKKPLPTVLSFRDTSDQALSDDDAPGMSESKGAARAGGVEL